MEERPGVPGVRVVLRHLIEVYPLATLALVVALLLAGLLEGFGVATLLPLLHLFLQGGGGDIGGATGGAWMSGLLAGLGLPADLRGVLGLLVGAIFLKALLLYLAMAMVSRASATIANNLRRRLLRATMAASWSQLMRRRPGETSAAIGGEPSRVASVYVHGCQGIALGLKALSYMILAFYISWQVMIAAVLGGALSFALLHRFVRSSRAAGLEMTRLQGRFLGLLVDALSGVKAIRAMGVEAKILPVLEGYLDAWRDVHARQMLSERTLILSQEPLRVIALGLVLPFLVGYWSRNPEDLLVLALLFSRIHAEIGTLQAVYQQIASSAGAFFFIHAQIDAAEASRERTGGAAPPRLEQAVVLDDVWFDYGGAPVLRGVDLEVPAGSFVALVGPSGAGKTTLTDLVLGLLEPRAGEVRVDGVRLGGVDLARWRRLVGYVPQDPVLLHDSVRANLRLGDDAVSEETMEAALRAACAWEFVADLEEGLETSVGEHGARFSGGQRQRLALARALCRTPRLLLLDEATSALDPETEARVCASLRALAGEVTVVAISHRETIHRLADRSYRLEAGRLVALDAAGEGAAP